MKQILDSMQSPVVRHLSVFALSFYSRIAILFFNILLSSFLLSEEISSLYFKFFSSSLSWNLISSFFSFFLIALGPLALSMTCFSLLYVGFRGLWTPSRKTLWGGSRNGSLSTTTACSSCKDFFISNIKF